MVVRSMGGDGRAAFECKIGLTKLFRLSVLFENMAMNPSPKRSLDLGAYDGWPIPNEIDADPDANAIALARLGVPPGLPHQVLGPPTGRYNCHGLVFASRRTNIPPPRMMSTTL